MGHALNAAAAAHFEASSIPPHVPIVTVPGTPQKMVKHCHWKT